MRILLFIGLIALISGCCCSPGVDEENSNLIISSAWMAYQDSAGRSHIKVTGTAKNIGNEPRYDVMLRCSALDTYDNEIGHIYPNWEHGAYNWSASINIYPSETKTFKENINFEGGEEIGVTHTKDVKCKIHAYETNTP